MAEQEEHEQQQQEELQTEIKLMFSRRCRSIVYAEAGKDFVDILLTFLEMPAAALVKLARGSCSSSLGRFRPSSSSSCIENIYSSVDAMPQKLLKTDKALILHPPTHPLLTFSSSHLALPASESSPASASASKAEDESQTETENLLYVCSNAAMAGVTHSVCRRPGVRRCACGSTVDVPVAMVEENDEAEAGPARKRIGYVKKTASFLITEGLRILPLNSTSALLKLWSELGVRDPADLDERSAVVGPAQIKALLKAALVSATPLNDVFNPSHRRPLSGSEDAEAERLALQGLLLSLLSEEHQFRFAKIT